MAQKTGTLQRFLPLILTVLVILADQISKAAIVALVPTGTIGAAFFGNFIQIIDVRNPYVAFSIGSQLPDILRFIVFTIGPIIILPIIAIYGLFGKDLSNLQRWVLLGIVGGGIGNLIDRIFRTGGVVDFIDVRFFGIFGWERWPTFNIADSSIVVCGIVLAISIFFARRPKHE